MKIIIRVRELGAKYDIVNNATLPLIWNEMLVADNGMHIVDLQQIND